MSTDIIYYRYSRTRDQRTAHIDLESPCDIAPGTRGAPIRQILSDYLGLDNAKSFYVRTSHLCENHSCSGHVCVNPLHLYFGSPSEDAYDRPFERRTRTFSKEHQQKSSKAGNKARWDREGSAHWYTSPDFSEMTLSYTRPEGWYRGRMGAGTLLDPQQMTELVQLLVAGESPRVLIKRFGIPSRKIKTIKQNLEL